MKTCKFHIESNYLSSSICIDFSINANGVHNDLLFLLPYDKGGLTFVNLSPLQFLLCDAQLFSSLISILMV